MSPLQNRFQRLRVAIDGHPEPWTIDPRWSGGRVRTAGRIAALGYAIFPVMWITISVILLIQFAGAWGTETTATRLMLILVPAIGLFSLIPFGGIIASKLAYGSTTLVLDTNPASPGGRFRGTVLTNMNAPIRDAVPEEFLVRVSCNRRRSSGSSSRSSGSSRQILWQQELHLESQTRDSRDGDELVVPITVDIPDGLPTTSIPGMIGETISWRVEVRGMSRRPKLRADFEIPVFDTRSAADREQQLFDAIDKGDRIAPPTRSFAAVAAALEADADSNPGVSADLDQTLPLRDLISTANDARREADPRPFFKRLFVARRPLDTIQRTADGSVMLTHVRGDQPVRLARRLVGIGALVLMFAAFHVVFFILMIFAFLMAKRARPLAVRIVSTLEALEVETVKGRRTSQRRYGWEQIGAVRPYQAGPAEWNLTWVIRRRHSVNPHLAV
ncbi:MAG: hypothetical protein EA403_17660, partial [Spirochaetaceae bacterium]